MKTLSVLLKPTSSRCNIECKYCFYKDEDQLRHKHTSLQMDDKTLKVLARRLFEGVTEKVSVVFQGGEPTLTGLAFYEKFIQYVKKYNQNNIKVELSLQTNGLLLDEKWCSFLKKNNFLVGLSFDGCPQVNDENRVAYNGTGVSKQVIRAIQLMQSSQVDYNILMVVTRQSANRARECYKYLKNIGVQYLQIIPVLDPYDGTGKEYSLGAEDLSRFMCDLFDIWYNDFICQREMRVTYFENIIYKLMGNSFTMCSMNGRCCIETVIEADGSVYPCDFYVSSEWELGNIHESDIHSLIFSEKANNFITKSVHVEDSCSKCPYFGLCIGACHRYRHNTNTDSSSRYCSAFHTFFAHSISRMKNISARMK